MSDPSDDPVRILCVDDDRRFAEMIEQQLERQRSRLDVQSTTDPTTVVETLETEAIDCVVSDYDMPELDGLELLSAVREAFPSKPFFLFTGRGSEEIASEAISKGVTDYLQKGTGAEQYELLANRCLNAVEKARHREQRRRTEKWYLQLFDQNLIGVGLSQNGVYRQVNGFFAMLLGRDPDDVVGMDVLDSVVPEDRRRVERALDRRESADMDQVRYTVDLHRPDGATRTVDVLGGQVTYEGEPAVLGLIRPVREERDVPGALAERLTMATAALGAVDGDLSEAVAKVQTNLERAQELLSDPVEVAGEDGQPTDLGDAAGAAWDLLEPGDGATLTVRSDAEIPAERALVVRTIEQILVGSVGSHPTDATVEVGPTDSGFEIRIEAPRLEDRIESLPADGVQSPPDPIVDSGWCVGIDVYSAVEAADTVTYEVVVASKLSD